MQIKSISQKEILEFNKNMSLMLLSSLSLVQAFELYLMKVKNIKLKTILKNILNDIRSGKPLSKSMKKYPDLFSELYLANLQIAEETGEISKVLGDYTNYQEKMYKLKKKIIEALRYPILVMLVSFGVIIFMVFFLIPTFEGLFFQSGFSLPLLTGFIVSASYLVKENFIFILLIIVLCWFALWKGKNSDIIRKASDTFLIKAPIISKLYKQNILIRFSFSMSIMLRSKISLIESLRITGKISKNSFFQSEIKKLIKKISRGESFSSNLSSSQFFDLTFVRLLNIGEEGADLEKVFGLIGDYYQEEFDYQLEGIIALIEPVLILFVGIVVATILVAMYMPMFDIINNFGV